MKPRVIETNDGSLPEWADAEKIFNEIYRVLKPAIALI